MTWRARTFAPDRVTVELYDLEGQLRLRLEGNTDGFSAWEQQSQLVGLAPGVYFYSIHATGSGDLSQGRLAILR